MLSVVESEVAHTVELSRSNWGRDHAKVRGQWLGLFVRAMDAGAQLSAQTALREPLEAFLTLGSAWLSHHRSLDWTLGAGRYGDSYAICRMLLEATDLLDYITLLPEEARAWRRTLDGDVPRAQLRRFEPVAIRKGLKELGVDPTTEGWYRLLSRAVHMTQEGALHYVRRDWSQRTFAPQTSVIFDPRTAFGISQVNIWVLPSGVRSFIELCERIGAPKRGFRKIASRYELLLPQWRTRMEVADQYSTMMAETERMYQEGKGVEAVMAFITEKYGESLGGDAGSKNNSS